MACLALSPFRPLVSSKSFFNSPNYTSKKKSIQLSRLLLTRAINGQIDKSTPISTYHQEIKKNLHVTIPCTITTWLSSAQAAQSSEVTKLDMVYETSELFELGIQLSYLLILLALLGAGTFFVIRLVLVRRELDLAAKELQDQVRSGDASATEFFELGAVMLRKKFYPAAIKYLTEAINKWDRDDQDLAQVYNALGVSYVKENKLEMGMKQFQNAVKLQPGYVAAWNNLGDCYEKKKELKLALRAFEEALLFDPNNKVARPRAETLRDKVQLYRGVTMKSDKKSR